MTQNYKDCNQRKCALLNLGVGCPACPECQAPPFVLCGDGLCVNCHCCEGDEGFIRKGKGERRSLILVEQEVKR